MFVNSKLTIPLCLTVVFVLPDKPLSLVDNGNNILIMASENAFGEFLTVLALLQVK